MANHSYPVEVQSDFLEKITRAKPVQALAELIWNSLDADASNVDVFVEQNELGASSPHTHAPRGCLADIQRLHPYRLEPNP